MKKQIVVVGLMCWLSGNVFADKPLTSLAHLSLSPTLKKSLSYPLPSDVEKPASPFTKFNNKFVWGLEKIGFFKSFGLSLEPLEPQIKNCSKEIVVAVVDTGMDYTHPNLAESVWLNPGEVGPWEPRTLKEKLSPCRDKSCNGLDDDGNGYADDVMGWDFVNNQPLPFDVHGHGTHIAGIVAGIATSASDSITGVCPGVKILPLKYYDISQAGTNNLQNTIRAFEYAVKMGVDIINYSGGGAEPAAQEKLALEQAQQRGILVVAAAGNDGHNNNLFPYFPASYPLDNIVSVASVDRAGKLLESSNYGSLSVDVAAPGHQIYSTLPGHQFGKMTGTSQATAFVTGFAALLMSQAQQGTKLPYAMVKSWIVKSTKEVVGNRRHELLKGGLIDVPTGLKTVLAEAKTPPGMASYVSLTEKKSVSPTKKKQ